MPNPKIHPAAEFSASTVRDAMLDAFSDYAIPLRLGQQDFDAMMRQRGLDLQSSRVAVVGDQVAAIWLTSVRNNLGYLISSGTRPAFRSRGLARMLGNDSLGHMRDQGVRSFQTEVLRNNETALGLYLSLGMVKQRNLDCYSIPIAGKRRLGQFDFQVVEWRRIEAHTSALRDWAPSWQNSNQSVTAISDAALCLACFEGGALAAYTAANPQTGVIYQMAVRDGVRRKGIASAMLSALQEHGPDNGLRLINVDGADDGFRGLMGHVRAVETIGQFELQMAL